MLAPFSAMLSLLVVASGANAITRMWDGGAGTDSWHDAANWSPDGVPGPTDDVIIDVPGEVNVVYSSGTSGIGSLDCEEHLALNGGTLQINGASTIRSFSLSTWGVLDGSGQVTVTEAMAWGNANIYGSAPLFIGERATLTIAGDERGLRRPLNNLGTMIWSSGSIHLANGQGALNNHGDFIVNAANGPLEMNANMEGCSVQNFGTMTKVGTHGASFFPCCSQVAIAFNNNGSVHVNDGRLTVMHGTHSGGFEVSGPEGTRLEFFARPFQSVILEPASSIVGTGGLRVGGFQNTAFVCHGEVDLGGDLEILSGDCTFNGDVNVGGTLTAGAFVTRFLGTTTTVSSLILNGGDLLQFEGAVTTIDSLQLTQGVLSGGGDVHVLKSMLWNNNLGWTSELAGAGRLIVDAQATLTIAVGYSSQRRLKRVLENHGSATMYISGGAVIDPALIIGDGAFINYGSFAVDVPTGPDVLRMVREPGSRSGVWQNAGTLTKSGGGILEFPATNDGVTFVNSGVVNLTGGRLELWGGGGNAGTLSITESATLLIGTSFSHEATSLVEGTGRLWLFAGVHNIMGNLTLTGQIEINGSSPPSVAIANSQFDLDIALHGGTLTVDAPQQWRRLSVLPNALLTGSGDIQLTENLVYRGRMAGAGQTIVDTGASLSLLSSPTLERELVNNGAATWQSGALTLKNGEFVNNGSLAITTANTCTMRGVEGTNLFNNQGVLTKAGAGTFLLTNAGAPMPVENVGSVHVNQGIVQIDSGGAGDGLFQVVAGAILRLGSQVSTGECDLAGTMHLTASGALHCSGTFTMQRDSELQVNRSAPTARVIQVDGEVTLAGELSAVYAPAPSTETTVDLLVFPAGALAGTFEEVTLVPNGAIEYQTRTVVWTVFQPGDTDHDDDVDVDDLIAVILSWGTCPKSPEACDADVTGDGLINVDDLIVIILNWGP